jgi:hypothetical protein
MCIDCPISLLRSLDWFVIAPSYKHSAPTELNAFGCGSTAPCLCGEFIFGNYHHEDNTPSVAALLILRTPRISMDLPRDFT